jgi:hypothetical protein
LPFRKPGAMSFKFLLTGGNHSSFEKHPNAHENLFYSQRSIQRVEQGRIAERLEQAFRRTLFK